MMADPALVAAQPYLVKQRYQDYTAEQHAVWSELVRRRLPQVQEYACQEYLEGFEIIGLRPDRLPNLNLISERLKPRTGWSATAVSGFLPADAFFEMLRPRMFPTTTWLRARDSLDYTSAHN
jgi:phenylalanine-4-hydroxylase